MDGEEGKEVVSNLSFTELTNKIERLKKCLSGGTGAKLPDGGLKLRANIKLHEEELQRRKCKEVDGCVRHESCSIGEPDNFKPQPSPSVSFSESTFSACFSSKQEAELADSKAANAFEKELYCLNPCDSKRSSKRQFSQQKKCKQELSNKTIASQAESSYATRHAKGEAVVLVDEEEEPGAIKATDRVDQVVVGKDMKIYYPSRVDPESVEIRCADMESLEPEAFLSSTIMNFYIRYLQEINPHADEYHFFNTYFYKKLKEAVVNKQNEKEASFVKLRRWWKGVNIFEKAYIFLPIHDDFHWSLVIICIPDKEEQLGPVLLHLDSLGLHSSKSLFRTIRKFLVQEWKFLGEGETQRALHITDKIWQNLPRRISENIIPVPQQRNEYDCGLFVLFFMERVIENFHRRLKKKDLTMFGRRWFKPEEASHLRMKIRDILEEELKNASED